MQKDHRSIQSGCQKILRECAKIQPGELVSIVTDLTKLEIALPLGEEADLLGAKTSVIVMMPSLCNKPEPPASVSALLLKSDVILLPLARAITHSSSLRKALSKGARAVSLTGFVPEMLTSGGIRADFASVHPTCLRVAALMSQANTIKITSEAGTCFETKITGRHGNAMPGIAQSGKFCPFPNIEANIAPVEGSTQGVAVIDASIPFLGIGIPKKPMILNIKDGRVISIEGEEEATCFMEHLKSFNDPLVYNIAEIGIGLNPEAIFRGIVIEDEGVLGTAHIALGTSASLGGKIQASVHYDLIMKGVTVKIDDTLVIDKGVFNVSL